MIKPELYRKTVDILFDAYFNDTLQHCNCYACAVGNIVAANMGLEYFVDKDAVADSDGLLQSLCWVGYKPYSRSIGSLKEAKWLEALRLEESKLAKCEEIICTGYSIAELAEIEAAFEWADKGESEEDYMFNGLVAVLEVLKQIHQVTDEDEVNNERFSDHYKKRTEALFRV